ncbi:uncharacterized protein LOC123441973 [Hordeum vulgare subsp. vulgare]|uniref:uncharacterized protein LOC123441973 n=1 Tax=Hordeum vulgare subsp. vulgare TaxID=112509 RepID=UPI001D1A4E26|nr:uncharacterized protein LOC123441973 [Hordeum vulgare subsp. vulgare]
MATHRIVIRLDASPLRGRLACCHSAQRTYITWPPNTSSLGWTRVHHVAALHVTTLLSVPTSLGNPTRHHFTDQLRLLLRTRFLPPFPSTTPAAVPVPVPVPVDPRSASAAEVTVGYNVRPGGRILRDLVFLSSLISVGFTGSFCATLNSPPAASQRRMCLERVVTELCNGAGVGTTPPLMLLEHCSDERGLCLIHLLLNCAAAAASGRLDAALEHIALPRAA